MRRTIALLATIFLALFIAVPSATAASPHFKKGGEPVCTVTDTSTTSSTICKGTLAGLGQETLHIDVTVKGFAVYQCQNGGGNTAPGQNKVVEGPSTTPTTINPDQIKNGNVSFTTNAATLTASPTATAAEAGCPNPNWTGVNPVIHTTDITMVLSQGSWSETCTASDPDGLSGTVPLNCG